MSVGLGHLIALGANMNYSAILTWAGRTLHTNVLAFSDIAWFCFIYFPASPRSVGLVWFLQKAWDGRKPCLWVTTVFQSLGALMCFPESSLQSFILLGSQIIKQSQRGSETKKCTNPKFMELGFELRALWGQSVLFTLCQREKRNRSL